MANGILTGHPLPRNEVPTLAYLFETSFDQFLHRDPVYYKDYLQALRTLIGLGFAAALADRDLLCIYKTYLQYFMQAEEGDFKKNPLAKRTIAQSASEMVWCCTSSFRGLGYPPFYEDFMQALHHTIAEIPPLMDQKTEKMPLEF